MWKLELDDKGYWANDGVNRHGPWARSGDAMHFMATNKPVERKAAKESIDEVVSRPRG
jgi:hypothetical protein